MQNKLYLNSISLNTAKNNVPSSFAVFPQSPAQGRDGRYFNYDKQTIINNFKDDQKDIPVDLDHHSEFGFNTKAVGWIKELFVQNNEIHARVEWTEEGHNLINNKAYRYISPAVYVNKNNNATLLSSVALTNHPNLKLPSLNSKQKHNINNKEQKEMESIKILNNALGLQEEAELNKTLSKIEELKNKQVDLNNFVPKTDYELVLNQKTELEQEFNSIKQATLQKEATNLIENAIKHGQISANSKDFYLDLCKDAEGLEKTKKHLENMPKLTDVVHANKKDNKVKDKHSFSDDEIKQAKAWGLSREDLVKARERKNKEDF